MDVAELLARRDLLAAAEAPQPSWVPWISGEQSTSDGYSVYPKLFGRWGFGFAERNQFSERAVFRSQDAACRHAWGKILGYTITGRLGLARFEMRPPDRAAAVNRAEGAELEALTRGDDYVTRAVLAQRPDLPVALLEELATDARPEVVWRVAANPSTPAEVLLRLDEQPLLRGPLALNPSLPASLVDAYTRADSSSVRWRIALHPAVAPVRLAELAGDADFGVRWGVAGNTSTPPDVLAAMVTDDEMGVRLALSLNPSTTPDALAALAADSFIDVRREIARNPRTPQPALALLATDPETSVALWVGRNPASSPATLTVMASHREAWVREHAADNWSTPVEVLQRLSTDRDPGVRKSALIRLAPR